jgi:secondary thiamine-phosphate synthase enzyme
VSTTAPVRQTTFEIRTDGPGLYPLTGPVVAWVRDSGSQAALLTLFVRHTSCSLLIQENADPDVGVDLLEYLSRLVPSADHPSLAYLRHVTEGPDDMPAHIKAALLPVSLQIPVADGRPLLGTWQGVFVVEHRTAPHRREVVAHLA